MKLHAATLLAATALCAALAGGSAHAGVVFQDNFESNTLDRTPAGWALGNSPTTFTVERHSQAPIGDVGDDRGCTWTTIPTFSTKAWPRVVGMTDH